MADGVTADHLATPGDTLTLTQRFVPRLDGDNLAARLTVTLSICVRPTISCCVSSPPSARIVITRHSCILSAKSFSYACAMAWLTTFEASESRYGTNSSSLRRERATAAR